MKSTASKVWVHVLGCVAFLALPFFFAPGPRISLDIMHNPHTRREFIGYVLMVLFFYANYFGFIPKLYFKGRYVAFAVFMLVSLLAITFIPPWIVPHQPFNMPPPMPEKGPGTSFLFEISHNFFGFLVVVFVSMTISINNKWKQVQEEKLVTELSYLKAQINPHFLFNTLNSIYALAIEKSDKTAMAVVKLSGMMRYVISEAHSDFVALEKEISYLGDYVELQKVRLEDTVQIVYEVTGAAIGKQIAPLVLIPFVENAFKYGVNPEENSVITIRIALSENELLMRVTNNKVNHRVSASERSGVGIVNARSRLQLLYPGKHELDIQDGATTFSVSLKMELE